MNIVTKLVQVGTHEEARERANRRDRDSRLAPSSQTSALLFFSRGKDKHSLSFCLNGLIL